MTREEIRLALINQHGCKQAGPSVQSQKDTVLSVSKMINRAFIYTHDHNLPTDNFLGLKRGRPEQWISRHADLVNLQGTIPGDCDDYTMTGIQCALILGVNPSRLAAVAVVGDGVIRRTVAIKPPIDHLIGGFFDGQDWLACFDTINQDRSEPWMPKIGAGRRPNRHSRHSGQLIAIASEGMKWRAFPESWFRFKK